MNDYQFKYQTHTNHVFLNVLNLYTAKRYHINLVDFKNGSDILIDLKSFNYGKWYYHNYTDKILYINKYIQAVDVVLMEKSYIPVRSKRIN